MSVAGEPLARPPSPWGESARSIAAVQCDSGMIPRRAAGEGDPWNHVEAAMALAAFGELDAAGRAYEWLARVQRPDGAFHASYRPDGSVADERLDTNQTAYVAAGALHFLLSSGDVAFARQLLAVVDRALGFVLAHQWPGGQVAWSVEPGGREGTFALLAASCSIHASLRAAARLARLVGARRPRLAAAAGALGEAIAWREPSFADRSVYAMDWYYPVLGGVLAGAPARRRLAARRSTFVLEGAGVRCRRDRRWVTTAETAECALAYLRAGCAEEAAALLRTTEDKRLRDGSYLTGLVLPERSSFPAGEASTYSTAAVLLAADALAGGEATRAVFSVDPRARPAAGLAGWPG
ncbi:MAG TPA: hypothetical protein VKV23_00150 [Acidimicrobiales bacterium]|nr:hypothetical protein [Acidimicrobiales bacterium]